VRQKLVPADMAHLDMAMMIPHLAIVAHHLLRIITLHSYPPISWWLHLFPVVVHPRAAAAAEHTRTVAD
jgi:hypothetical protein